jgi:hypothetical protein
MAGEALTDRADRAVVQRACDGRSKSTISGTDILLAGRKIRSVALPSQASSCGGLPTTMDGVDRVAPQATE